MFVFLCVALFLFAIFPLLTDGSFLLYSSRVVDLSRFLTVFIFGDYCVFIVRFCLFFKCADALHLFPFAVAIFILLLAFSCRLFVLVLALFPCTKTGGASVEVA